MFRVVLSVFLIISTVQTGFSQQQNQSFDVAKLGLVWQLKDNEYKDQSKSLSEFILTNKSDQVFPATGWSIYFQCIKTIDLRTVSGDVIMEHLNGTLYRIIPSSSFKAIPSNQKLNISFVANAPIINYTDQPAGPYLVWDSNPDKYYKITDYKVAPMEGLVSSVSPATIFDQNKEIVKTTAAKILPTPVKYVEKSGSFILKPGRIAFK